MKINQFASNLSCIRRYLTNFVRKQGLHYQVKVPVETIENLKPSDGMYMAVAMITMNIGVLKDFFTLKNIAAQAAISL